ncbi:hypothetical protein GCM10010106_49620 [Thermopolyspora flexuosa]|uniref:DUF4190 domain-containing protein n=1 Tax=Thermopolyspora flexuosa TaxID=103836 RepID=A0A543IQF6_9ACTN|nr:DUF4190 domain-containing protein [Thermopolyspora flexuosa]TQM72811.1 hypothetical protein FHX40_4971 [Thermopolyspora flexuosa]GGM94965.1 hypothetical protein GCM10010106_49620 [Thermopolyspora flexuosa]
MTRSGDPYRPDRREGATGRPWAPGRHARTGGPDEPTVALPRLTPPATEWGTRVASGPAGATAYSADSPDLFPPLPEPEPRHPSAPAPGTPAGATAAAPPRRAADRGPGTAPPPFAWPDEQGASGPDDADRPANWEPWPGPSHRAGGARPWPPRRRKGARAATAALVLGVASLLSLPLCGVGALVAVAGLVTGVVGVARGAARGRAVAGLLLSALTLAIVVAAAAWLASTGVARCLDEHLYPTRADAEACVAERLGIPAPSGY